MKNGRKILVAGTLALDIVPIFNIDLFNIKDHKGTSIFKKEKINVNIPEELLVNGDLYDFIVNAPNSKLPLYIIIILVVLNRLVVI